MLLLKSLLALALVAEAVVGGDSAFFQDAPGILAVENLDPIVTPNAQASHMHRIVGGSAFGASYNFATYSSASCSQLPVQADKSNYWMPQLYWIDKSSSRFIPLTASTRIYYFLVSNKGAYPVKPWPKGLRMVAGSPGHKAPSLSVTYSCHVTSSMDQDIHSSDFNFNSPCPFGLESVVFFPPCWDGVNLHKSDNSHMAYPLANDARDAPCPISHPVKLPSIQMEYTWTMSVNKSANLAGNLIWSNGDTTGYGLHADFVNGWVPGVLGAALNDSTCNTGASISASACNSLAKYYDASAAVKCGPTLGTLQESFGNSDLIPIPRLPGCNPVWGASGVKPTCNPPIAALDVSAFTGANDGNLADSADQLVFPLSTQPGWHDWFCVNGLKGVLGGGFTTDPALTRDSCQNSCLRGGYQYAGIGKQGSSWTCVCGHSIDYSTQIAEGMCTQPCPGNSSQTCGNTWIYQLSYAANGTAIDWSSSAMSDGTINMGCYSNPGNPALGLMGQQTYSYTSDSMTSAICIAACKGRNSSWAATFSGNTCYCGTNFIYGTGGFTESNLCTVKCLGNSSETCGDNYRMNVYNITAASANANGALHPAGWQGCYAEGSGHYALANHSWSSSAMTPMTCINGCNELGYAYAGLENGQFCFCGSQFQGGQSLPESSCSKPCSGNSSAVCGGQSTLDLYSMAAATVSLTSLPEVKLGNYMGCFVDSGSTTALTDYSYQTSTMTVPTCLQACTEFGYNYAGVENANVCKCGKTAPATTRVPTPINCVRACVGSSSQTCGAGGYLEVYNLTKSSSTVGLNLTKSASASSTSTSAASASGSPNATSALFPSPSGSTSYLGCFADTTSNRALSAYSFTLTGMTVAMCQSGCNEMGYSLGGVENGNMCFCGSSFSSASHQQLPTSSCNVACSGSSTTTCGGSSAVAIYTATGAYNPATYPSGYIGCYTDSTARTLPGSYYSDWSMSSQQCRTACAASQFSIAGTESGGSCACGNSIATSGTKLPSAYCSTPCLVNVNETCGGNWRISVYNSTGAVVKANGIKGYAGCFNDYSALKGYSFSSDWMSTDICTRQCLAHGFAYAGLHASQCMCGNTSPIQLAADSNCASTCTAAPTESCGTSSAAAVYNVKNAGLTSGAFNLSPNSTGFAGCFTDSSSGRTLYSATFTSSTMTNDLCVANCKALGYAYAGTESATGCFCGNALNVTGTSYQVAAGNCATACQGGRGQVCGGSSRISIYDTSKYSSSSMTALPVVEGLKGCYGTGSFLTGSPYTYGSPWSTNELCRRTCRTKGYSIAGLTNGNTCGCANDTSLLGAQTAISACNVACNGNANQTCGGGFSALVSVFDTTGAGAQVPSGYPSDYVGCYADSSSSHMLSGATVTINSMSSTYCKSYCNSYGYGVSGTENGNVCYCGAALPTPLGLFPDSQCSTPCAGRNTEMCGAGSRISVYYPNLAIKVPLVAASSSASSSSANKSATVSPDTTSSGALRPTTSSSTFPSITTTTTSKVPIVSTPSTTASTSSTSRTTSTSTSNTTSPIAGNNVAVASKATTVSSSTSGSVSSLASASNAVL